MNEHYGARAGGLRSWIGNPCVCWCCAFVLLATSVAAQNKSAQQTPQTAPQVKEVLSSYEGQRVVAIELAGRPGLDEKELRPFLAQKQDEPFSQAKVEQSIHALKGSGKAKEVELEIRPQADGIRLMFVLQPAIYFGIFTFPGADGSLTPVCFRSRIIRHVALIRQLM